MKVTALWVYPIKALRGIPLEEAELGPQGLKHDRSFMICRVGADGSLAKLQLAGCPECALFHQEMRDGAVRVRYQIPREPLVAHHPLQDTVLDVPLEPDTAGLDRADVNVHQSMVSAYRMGSRYDEWFSACFGFPTVLLYIGDQRRPILGTFSPRSQQQQQQQQQQQGGWLSSITSYVTGGSGSGSGSGSDEPDWLRFSDCAPYLITTEASLANVRSRISSGDVEMFKFRPNVVLDGEGQYDEDFWATLSLRGRPAWALSKMCGRCASVNVDYDTGRPGLDDRGAVLKRLMADRRVDPGHKYSPVFGRYAFLADDGLAAPARVALGDQVDVDRRNDERPVWDWPMKDTSVARYYHAPGPQAA